MVSFIDLDLKKYSGALVLLDIDGTLTHDHGYLIDDMVCAKIRELASVADVHLCSNGSLDRTRQLAESLGVHYVDSLRRKPSRSVMEHLLARDRRVVVIGDKLLTDGLFAKNIGAEFELVERVRVAQDSLVTKAIYALDDLIGRLVLGLFPLWPLVQLLRPFQWVKNVVVFFPAFFAGTLFHPGALGRTALAALTFCTVASVAYIVNDLCDIEQDRRHPTKRFRSLPSGRVSPMMAKVLLLLLIGMLGLEMYLIPQLLPVIAGYAVLNVAYSFRLKHIAVLDIALVATCYVLRILAGGLADAIPLSPWIVLCTFFAALFIVIGKRRAEFVHAEKRKVLDAYTQQTLDALLLISMALTLASYGLYSVLGSRSPYAVYSTILVVVALFRMLNLMFQAQRSAEYPEQLLFKDKGVLLTMLAWVLLMGLLLYI